MFWLVESDSQFEEISRLLSSQVFVLPIKQHDEQHPKLSSIICLFIADVEKNENYLINIKHPEALQVDFEKVKQLLSSRAKVYTADKKALTYYYYGNNVVDLHLCHTVKPAEKPTAYSFYYQRYFANKQLNSIIPIVKHFEYACTVYENAKVNITSCNYTQYYDDLSLVFWFIEQSGIRTTTAWEKYFPTERPWIHQNNGKVYTQYNLTTQTGRPSNTYNSVNFAAIPKVGGFRECIIPDNDLIVEIDLTAYHPTLIAQLVEYESESGDIYEDFAKAYSTTRDEAKSLVFRQLYGNIYSKYEAFPLFQKTKMLIETIWKQANKQGYYEGFISKQKFYVKDIENITPQKFFNYLIQNHETANNVEILKEILYNLNNKKSKLILYTYDAFLFDIAKDDKVVRDIVKIFEKRGLKIKISYGSNYGDLQPY